MSPTVFRARGLRFFFFSREKPRVHIHIVGPHGEAKIWIDPKVEVARNLGFDARTLHLALELVREREYEIRQAWNAHFGS